MDRGLDKSSQNTGKQIHQGDIMGVLGVTYFVLIEDFDCDFNVKYAQFYVFLSPRNIPVLNYGQQNGVG